MNKIFKIGLLMTIIALAFTSGVINVSAADDAISFNTATIAEDAYGHTIVETTVTDLSTLDLGDIPFGSSAQIYFIITNNTSSTVTIHNQYFGANTDHFTLYKVNQRGVVTEEAVGGLSLLANENRPFLIQIDAATEDNFGTRNLDTIFTLSTSTTNFTINVTATDVKKTIETAETPTINPATSLTYHGAEQTMDFHTYDGTDYTLIDFNDADSIMTISGNKGTSAGDYTAQITLKNTDLYQWHNSLSEHLSGANNETYSIDWEIERFKTPLPSSTFSGAVGHALSTVTLPEGWTWDEPAELIDTGTNNYNVTFNHPDNSPNHATASGEIAVEGYRAFNVNFVLDSNGSTDAGSNSVYLKEGSIKEYTLTADAGYLFSSIKINGIEQIASGVAASSHTIPITNISENYTIIATTERIIFTPMAEYTELIYDRAKDKTLQVKWDLDFFDFVANNTKINNIVLTAGFKFSPGSVILDLDNEVLASLPLGRNVIEIDLESGELVTATFTVIDSSSSGSGSNSSSTENTNNLAIAPLTGVYH